MDCETDGRIQNEYAVRCTIVSKPVYVLEYIKSISSLVGASHILAAFEESDSIKVFFDDKRHVDTLLRSCLHVMGRHVRVDYVKPPGAKLILSNVDPIITNFDIMRLLALYGTIVSPVIRPPISDDVELCHISYGVRYVYMILNGCIPEKVEFRYGDQLCYFKVCVVESSDSLMLPCIKTDDLEETQLEVQSNSTVQSHDSLPGPSGNDTFSIQEVVDPILVSVQSVPEVNSKEQVVSLNLETPAIKANSSDSSMVETIEGQVTIVKRRRGRPPMAQHKKMSATSQAAKRIKNNVKHKWIRKRYRKAKCGRKPLAKSNYCKTSPLSPSHTDYAVMPDLINMNERGNSVVNEPTKVLDSKKLTMFLREVKGHRAPLELARKYIGHDCDSDKIYKFVEQLQAYKKKHDNLTLKTRIWRLVKSINDALTSENND